MSARQVSQPGQELERDALEQCQAGRIEGLEMLYRLHSQRVYRTCLRVLGDRSQAEDATQEVFLRVHDKAVQFDRRSAFTTWLYRLSVNHCLNRLRSRVLLDRHLEPLDREIEPAAVGPGPHAALAAKEDVDLVQGLLARLSPEHRAAVALREIEGLSYREIASVLQVPTGTVMSRLHRARGQLKELLSEIRPSGVRAFPRREAGRADRRPGDGPQSERQTQTGAGR